MCKSLRMAICAMLFVLPLGSVHAVLVVGNWTILTDPYFFERSPGPDNWWGTGDDSHYPGSNTNVFNGSWAYDLGSPPDSRLLFGFGKGGFSTEFDTDTGAFDFLSFNAQASFYDTVTPLPPAFLTATLAPGVNAGQLNLATLEFTYDWNQIFDNGVLVNSTGVGWLLPNLGFPAEAIFGPGDVATSLNFAVGFLPDKWTNLAVFQTDLFLPDFGLPGTATWFAYTVPEPTTLALMGLALAGFGFQRRKAA